MLFARLPCTPSSRAGYFAATSIVDEDGRAIKRNRIAERLIGRHDGLCVRQERLHASCPLDERRLQKALRAALEHFRAGALASKPPRCRAPAARSR
ncbi:hypothetical protein [Burkholderia sp. BCC0322]|uniref:hypothetical protein n=1 Tax=unclassified Burkholderia TaxID=2613784 RepID=UPI001FC85E7A|nr:hypothetical protein [Burkholderia sp. BCC0322]